MTKFRLYPKQGSSLYALVIIHDTREQMLAQLNPNSQNTEKLRAFESGIQKWKHGKKLPIFTEIHCHKNDLSPELIAHELIHATFTYALRVGLKPEKKKEDYIVGKLGILPNADNDEEKFCSAHTKMFIDFVIKIFELQKKNKLNAY